MEAFLKKYDNIAGVFGHNDEEAIGAVQAIEEAGMVPGEDIKVIGVDATAHGFEYLIPGKINALIECNPLLAPQVYEAALNGDERRGAADMGAVPGGRVLRRPGCGRAHGHPRDAQVLASQAPPHERGSGLVAAPAPRAPAPTPHEGNRPCPTRRRCSRCTASPRPSPGCRPSPTSTSTSTRARSTRSSARTAPANRPSSRSSPAWSVLTPAT